MEIFNTYIKEALRWKGASMKSAQALPSDHKTQLSIMRLTTKSCLDAYLMRIFNIDECTARDVSNALTQRNLPSDMTADLDDFKAEPWHPEQITKNKTIAQKNIGKHYFKMEDEGTDWTGVYPTCNKKGILDGGICTADSPGVILDDMAMAPLSEFTDEDIQQIFKIQVDK